MIDEELQNKKDYSAIKEVNEDEKLPECRNLLNSSHKNTTNDSSKQFQLDKRVEVNYGKNKILLFHKGEPLIVLGPHCKLVILQLVKNKK